MAAERDKNSVYQDMLHHLRDQLQNDNYAKAGFQKGYYTGVSKKLARDMMALKEGLEGYTITAESI